MYITRYVIMCVCVYIYLLIKISYDLNNADIIITPISQMRKLRLREAKWMAQGFVIAVTFLFKIPRGCLKPQIVANPT